MLRTLRTTAVALVLIAASPVPGARADVLHVVNQSGLLRSIDPATGTVVRRIQLRAQGKVVTSAAGLGAGPGGGLAYALVAVADECAPCAWLHGGCLEFGGTTEARTTRKLAAHDAPPPTVCASGGS